MAIRIPYLGAAWRLRTAIAFAAFAMTAPGVTPAVALEPYTLTSQPFWTIDEIRAGAFKQAIDDAAHEGTAALNLEVLGGRFGGGYEDSILDFFLTPRPHLGTTLAFGKTDEFYWGLSWDAKLTDRTFFEGSLGGAAHDGPLDTPHEASYGCTVNFRESGSLGFALSSDWRLMATIDHMSNGGLCNPNRGLTNAGVRLGYRW
ncbi:MAG: acyloxyacyl hydrolase [Rhodomicrobium sp.]